MEKLKLKKGNVFLYIVLLAIVLAVMIVSRNMAFKRNGTILGNVESDTLRIGIQISPIGVSTNSDTLCGFYYDMIRQIAENENQPVKIDGFTQISSALQRLDNGYYDVVIADIPVTQELRQNYLFTVPIYADREVLVQLKDSITGLPPIRSQSQLRGDTVYISAYSPFLSRIRNLSHELGDTIYVIQDEEYGPEQMMIMTAIGEMPNVVVNEQVAKSIARDYPQLDLSVSLSFNQFQSWAVAKTDSLLRDSLDVWLARYKETERFGNLLERYFNEKPVLPEE